MEKILVTGGAGFIGSNFIMHMLGKKPDVAIVNLDKLTYAGNLENLKSVEKNPNYEFVKGDICDAKVVAKAMKGCDVVVNFAAESHVDRSINSNAYVACRSPKTRRAGSWECLNFSVRFNFWAKDWPPINIPFVTFSMTIPPASEIL